MSFYTWIIIPFKQKDAFLTLKVLVRQSKNADANQNNTKWEVCR